MKPTIADIARQEDIRAFRKRWKRDRRSERIRTGIWQAMFVLLVGSIIALVAADLVLTEMASNLVERAQRSTVNNSL